MKGVIPEGYTQGRQVGNQRSLVLSYIEQAEGRINLRCHLICSAGLGTDAHNILHTVKIRQIRSAAGKEENGFLAGQQASQEPGVQPGSIRELVQNEHIEGFVLQRRNVTFLYYLHRKLKEVILFNDAFQSFYIRVGRRSQQQDLLFAVYHIHHKLPPVIQGRMLSFHYLQLRNKTLLSYGLRCQFKRTTFKCFF
ncbi:hypothetical protein FQZ97_814330 [compost metagenome]